MRQTDQNDIKVIYILYPIMLVLQKRKVIAIFRGQYEDCMRQSACSDFQIIFILNY